MLGDSGTNLLDKYQVLDQIGEGTYGQVYRARCRASGAALALKKIRLLSESQQGLPLSLVREIKILSKLSHRCMVQLVEVVTSRNGGGGGDSETGGGGGDGDLYLVMEYVDHDLSGLLDVRHPFSELEIKCILKQLLEVLMYIHGAQVRVLGSNTAAHKTPRIGERRISRAACVVARRRAVVRHLVSTLRNGGPNRAVFRSRVSVACTTRGKSRMCPDLFRSISQDLPLFCTCRGRRVACSWGGGVGFLFLIGAVRPPRHQVLEPAAE